MTDPLPNDELRALIALEKGALVDPGAARARLASRLASRFPGATAPKTAKAPFWRGGAAAGAALFGAGLVVGAGVSRLAFPPAPKTEVRYVDRVVEVVRVPRPLSWRWNRAAARHPARFRPRRQSSNDRCPPPPPHRS
jgi:hypothetical protein